MIHQHKILIILSFFALLLSACIEDGISTSPSAQPRFSTDTLKMGTVYTAEQTATHRFVVYNPNDKGINLSRVNMTGDNAALFRVNVDGMSGTTFSDIEIRANDSIYVFVSADLPENGTGEPRQLDARLDFTVNGITSSVVISATGQDVVRQRGVTITGDTQFTAACPYQIIDSLVVEQGATLTLLPGTKMLMHDNARMIVRGTLRCEGTAAQPVRITGDRMGNVITDVSFNLMSRQWFGIDFLPESRSNYIAFTEISNTSAGVTVWGDGINIEEKRLTLINSRLRNSGDCVLSAIGASVEAYGCEFAEAASSLVHLLGGDHRFDQCTVSNHYLFSAISGAAWTIDDPYKYTDTQDMLQTKALITNTITWGLGADVTPGDLSGWEVYFKRCLFKSAGTDDDNFIDSIWDTDPLFYTVRSDYIFDYRLKPESPAIGVAYPDLSEFPLATDYYGVERRNDLGAYVFVAEQNDKIKICLLH